MKPIVAGIVAIFAVMTLALTLFMPAAELIPAQVSPAPPVQGESPLHCPKLMTLFNNLGKGAMDICGIKEDMGKALSSDPNFPYYVYSFFLALALSTSALAISIVGRLDSEEKTILPLKK